jgi:hypothetical protein
MSDMPQPAPRGGEAITSPPVPEAGWSAAPELSALGAQEPYRPVSLLALAGLALAVLYAVAVTIGGLAAFAGRYPRAFKFLLVLAPLAAVLAALLARVRGLQLLKVAGLGLAGVLAVLGMGSLVAFSGSNPYLLPGWSLLVALAAVLISWAARVRIQRSEGTLSGLPLTSWGLGLSLVFGLNYAAYYGSNLLAVQQQARAFSDEWVALLRQGQLDKAFLMTLEPSQRPREGPELRRALEVRFNQPSPRPGSPGGIYSQFTQSDFVRLLMRPGDTVVAFKSVGEWRTEGTSYTVPLLYAVQTDVAEFELQVTVTGTEPKGQLGGRRWAVRGVGTETGVPPSSYRFTDKGREVLRATQAGQRFAYAWVQRLREGAFADAYLDTLPPGQRRRQEKAARRCRVAAVAAGPAPLALTDADCRAYQKGLQAFCAGGIVRAEPGTFWSSRPEQISRAVKAGFSPGSGEVLQMHLREVRVPLWQEEGGRIEVAFTVQMPLLNPQTGRPRAIVEGNLVVEARTKAEGPPDMASWRVQRLELLRGHTPAAEEGPPGPRPGLQPIR